MCIMRLLLASLCVISFCTGTEYETLKYPPVILVPGDGGSQLEAKLDKPSTVSYVCSKKTNDYFSIWLNLELLLPLVIDCWVDNMKLLYNNKTRETTSQPGVEVRVSEFGDPFTVEYLDPSKISVGAYFRYIADALVAIGYERGINLFGAPYDFRKGPSEHGVYYDDLKALIEKSYEDNGNTSVVMIGHSMGGPMCLVFLNRQTKAWKDKYIRSLITLSGAWAGAVKAIKVYCCGDDLNVYLLNEKILKGVQITMPSIAWLMPHELFWSEDVLVESQDKNYTISNIYEYFRDINYTIGWEMYKDQREYLKNFEAPGVELHCLYGDGVSTIEKLVYKSNKFPDNPLYIYGDGDGTVNQKSLKACEHWLDKQKERIHLQGFYNVDHFSILSDKTVIQYITETIKSYINES